MLAGYEAQLYLGALAAPGVIRRGFRTTPVFGAVAAAAAAAKVLRLDTDRTAAALALGANFACGLIESWAHGTSEGYLQVGVAAQNGVLAALLARAGAPAAHTTLDGANGFLRAFGDVTDAPSIPVRDAFRIMGVSCKPYPISAGKLTAVDSALAWARRGIDPARITRVRAHVPDWAERFPGGNRAGPYATPEQAQTSLQFCIAAALLGHPMDVVATFAERFADPGIAALTHAIELVGEPGRTLVRLEVAVDGGEAAAVEADWPQTRTPDLETMTAKLRTLAAPHWPAGAADDVAALLCGPGGRSVNALTRLLRIVDHV